MENSEKNILTLITESKGNDLLDDEKLIKVLIFLTKIIIFICK